MSRSFLVRAIVSHVCPFCAMFEMGISRGEGTPRFDVEYEQSN